MLKEICRSITGGTARSNGGDKKATCNRPCHWLKYYGSPDWSDFSFPLADFSDRMELAVREMRS